MVRVKICGITNLNDALAAIELGADALGFVFAPSPRKVTTKVASRITSQIPPFVTKVGIFADAPFGQVRDSMEVCYLDLVQLHGEESPEYCALLFPQAIKAFRVKDEGVLKLIPRYHSLAYLLDSHDPAAMGGTGQRFDWAIAQKATSLGPIILSGGLNPENITEAITLVRPYAVDVSSGVESRPGKKDWAKLRLFFSRLREAEERLLETSRT